MNSSFRVRLSAALALATQLGTPSVTLAQDRLGEGTGPDQLREQWSSSRASKHIVGQWNSRLRGIDELILEGEYEKARKKARRLGDEMTNRIIEWESTGQALGLVTILRALAAAGAGDHHESHWYWKMALYFFPDVEGYNLTAYGEAAVLMKTRPDIVAGRMPEGVPSGPKTMTPPRRRGRDGIEYPQAKYSRRVQMLEPVVVSVTLDEEGHPWFPFVVTGGDQGAFAYSALDAMGRWRYVPAKINGVPMAVMHTLTINYAAP